MKVEDRSITFCQQWTNKDSVELNEDELYFKD